MSGPRKVKVWQDAPFLCKAKFNERIKALFHQVLNTEFLWNCTETAVLKAFPQNRSNHRDFIFGDWPWAPSRSQSFRAQSCEHRQDPACRRPLQSWQCQAQPVQLPVLWAGSAMWPQPRCPRARAQWPEGSSWSASPASQSSAEVCQMCVFDAKFISATAPCRALAGKPSPNQTTRDYGGADPLFLF